MTQTAYTNPNSGLHSIVEASEDYELAPLGIASMKDQAEKLAEFGRYGDVYVVHAAKGETVIPMEVLEANPHIKSLLFNQMEEMGLDPNRYVVGNEFNSLNPVTGMPEFFFKKIFKKIKKAAKKVFKVIKKIAPIAIPIAASVFGIPFLAGLHGTFAAGGIGAAALGSGIGTLVGGGSLKDALKSAAIGGGLAGLTGGLKGLWKAPAGTGLEGFGAGVKSAATGVTPIYDAVGNLVGQQAAATPGQMWDAVMGGDFTGALTGDVGTTTYTPDYLGQFVGGRGSPVGNILPSNLSKYVPAPQAANISGLNPNLAGVGSDANLNLAGVSSDANLMGASGSDTSLAGQFQQNLEISPYINDPVNTLTAPRLDSQYVKDVMPILKSNAAVGTPSVDAATSTPFLGGLSPTAKVAELVGYPVSSTVANVGDLALGVGGTYLAGGFKEQPEEDLDETKKAAQDVFDPIVIDPVLAEQSQIDVTTQIPTTTAEELLQPTLFSADGGIVQKMAVGGYPRRELLVEGPGTEKSDDIPAMLSDGEFVINSRAVRGADPSGRGNRYAGANNLYNLMRNFEMRA
jgi:hypothetical protein